MEVLVSFSINTNLGSLQIQTMKQQSELSNISDAQNYMSTAESALSQINEKINQTVSQIATLMLLQMNSVSQNLLTLFR